MKKTILATARNEQQAQQIVDQLRSANLSIQDISIVYADQKGKTTEQGSNAKSTQGKGQGKSSQGSSWTKEGHVVEEGSQTHHHEGTRTETGRTSESSVTLNGSLGRLGNATRVTLPGSGAVIIAGPFKNAFGGASRTTSVGTAGVLTGTLVGFGFSETDAKRFEEKMKKGSYLVAFQATEMQDLDHAKAAFKKAGAEEVVTSTEANAQKKARV